MVSGKVSRRSLLQGLGAAALGGAALAGCSGSDGNQEASSGPTPSPVPTSSRNPLGVPSGSGVQLWADTSRYPLGWTDALVQAAAQLASPVTVHPNSTTQVATDLRARLDTDQAPDVVLNGGSDPLGIAELAGELDDLTPLLDLAREGTTLRKQLRPGTVEAGTLGGRVVALPWVYTVHGLWFSSSLLASHGWQAPETFDDLLTLGARAHAKGLYLFCWGRETATWFLRMTVAAAIKQGGDAVRRSLDDLDPDCWTQPSVQTALRGIHEMVTAGYVKPGGASRSWKDAMTAWSRDRKVLFVPSGSWIAAQAQTDENFGLDLAPDPALGSGSALPVTAVHVQPEQGLMVPSHAPNAAGGKATIAAAFTPAVAQAFCRTNQVLSTLAGVEVTSPGAGLVAQQRVLAAAGKHVFGWRFIDTYGTNHDFQALWNGFLAGSFDVATLTRESQRITDLVRSDPAQVKYSS